MADTGHDPDHVETPARHRTLALTGICIIAFMQFIDGTVANVALPHMQASLGATLESISWVLTSYVLASAVAIPISGWLAGRIGGRNLMLLSAAGFLAASAACGAAASLEAMVGFRVLQGFCGAFILPLSQSLTLDMTPQRGQLVALNRMGMISVFSPIIGPLVGGVITENFNWRWIFYINLPLGIPALALLWFALPRGRREPVRLDLAGYAMIVVGLFAYQLMLDRGQSHDWFDSPEIMIEAGIALAALWMFVVQSMTTREPLFARSLFRDPVIPAGCLVMALMGFLMFGTGALMPAMVQQVYGYPVLDAGLLIVPRGVGTLVGMALCERLARHVPARWMVVGGYAAVAATVYAMTGWGPTAALTDMVVLTFIQGLAMGMTFTPLNVLVFASVPAQQRTSTASILSLSRNIGAGTGLAIFAANLVSSVQTSHEELAASFSQQAPAMIDPAWLRGLDVLGLPPLAMIDQEINHQALMIGYLNDLWLLMWVIVIALPVMALLLPSRTRS